MRANLLLISILLILLSSSAAIAQNKADEVSIKFFGMYDYTKEKRLSNNLQLWADQAVDELTIILRNTKSTKKSKYFIFREGVIFGDNDDIKKRYSRKKTRSVSVKNHSSLDSLVQLLLKERNYEVTLNPLPSYLKGQEHETLISMANDSIDKTGMTLINFGINSQTDVQAYLKAAIAELMNKKYSTIFMLNDEIESFLNHYSSHDSILKFINKVGFINTDDFRISHIREYFFVSIIQEKDTFLLYQKYPHEFSVGWSVNHNNKRIYDPRINRHLGEFLPPKFAGYNKIKEDADLHYFFKQYVLWAEKRHTEEWLKSLN